MAWYRSLALSFAVAGTGLAVAAALAAGTNAPAGGELRAVSAADVASLDPALVQEPLGWEIMLATCTTLFVDGPGRGTPRLLPEAAASFPSISNHGLTYVFTIRPRLRFADGSPLTAAAFARAIGRVLDPRMHAPAASQFASAIAAAHARANRLTIRLMHPRGDLIALLTMPWACPVPPGLPIDPTGVDTIPGSGPYTIVEHLPAREIVLRRNPFYRVHGRGDPRQSPSPSAAQPTPTCSQSNKGAPTSTSTSFSPQSKRRHRNCSSTSPHVTASAAANSSLGPSTRRCSSR